MPTYYNLTCATARVAVHSTAVADKFTPHDTSISIATADELSDAALTSACSLHTAAPSSSSSTASSRRNRLHEITEDAEEGHTVGQDTATPSRPATGSSSIPDIPEIVEPVGAPGMNASEMLAAAAASEAPQPGAPLEEMHSIAETKSTPELSQHVVEIVPEEEQKQPESQPELTAPNYRDSLKQYDPLFEYGPDPRFSSQTARPTYSELYDEIYAKYNKPKVKLGPRPRPSLDSKRPKTSGSGELSVARPISSLPAGLRVANRRTAEPKRPKSRDSSIVPSIAFPPPPPIPEIPPSPTFSYHSHRPVSVKSMPSYGHRSSGVTPEKQRLMKALELRKKQMMVKKEQGQKKEEPSPCAEEYPEKGDDALAMPSSSMETVTEGVSTAAKTVDETAALQQPDDLPTSSGYAAALDDIKASMTHKDSSLSMMSSQGETDDLHSAVSAYSPTSAQTQGSSCAPSTRPSSLSEDDHHIPEEDIKLDETHRSRDSQLEEPRELLQNEDEKESVQSSPTEVPENDSSVASVEVTPQTAAQPQIVVHDFASDSIVVKKSRRESTIFVPPIAQTNNDLQRSEQEPMVLLSFESSAQQEGASTTRQKRQSIISIPKRRSFVEVKEKRMTIVKPIQIHLSAENSDVDYLSDDSFMEELQSATMEQAQPVSVSKSPMASYFPRKSSVTEISTPKQSTFGQQKLGGLTPEQQAPRKMSGTWPPQSTADSVVLAKKINVSSGISQRIKALAEKSSRELSVSPTAGPDVNTSIVAQRKSSFFSATPPIGDSPPRKLSSRHNRASFVPVAFSSTTPDRKTVIQPPKTADSAVYNVQQEPTKPESVQVTARIVRDPRIQKPALTMPTESTPLELHQSPIIIDHQKPASSRPSSRSSKHSPSKMEPTSPISNPPRSSSESSWRSFGRRMSESKAGGVPRSQSSHSLEMPDEKKEEKKEKKDSRASKLFKRMSTMSSISRKSQSSSNNSLAEEERQSYSLPSLREPPPAVQVGDLNIQFPDTLVSPSCTLILIDRLTYV
jgi:hypothetical protein